MGQAFGLKFRSKRPLAEMAACTTGLKGDLIEIDWQTSLMVTELVPVPPRPVSVQATQNSFKLHVPDVAAYRVTKSRIAITPGPGVAETSIRAYLFGSAIGALLHMRQVLILHGSAVRLPDGSAAVFCGLSTAGKSTLAAALAARGHRLMADDICAVRIDEVGHAWCLPGLARSKLWRHALDTLGLSDHARPEAKVLPGLDKYTLSFDSAMEPAPLTRFYELQVHDQLPLAFSAITGLSKVSLLVEHTFRPSFVTAMGLQPQHLRRIAALAPRLKAVRIARPRDEPTLNPICDWLEQQWRTH
jgi:hypothetical protein